MAELGFECVDVSADRFALGPTLLFKIRITESTGAALHTVALRCQIRIEPQRRGYGEREAEQLADVFGAQGRWGETLKPFQFATTSAMVAGFTGDTEATLEVPCTYDLDVAAGKFFHALDSGEIPLLLMFSGTVFGKAERGLWVEQVPWHVEARYRLPVAVWHELMDRYFPGSGWLRLRRETIDALTRYKSSHTIATWDETLEALMKAAAAQEPQLEQALGPAPGAVPEPQAAPRPEPVTERLP